MGGTRVPLETLLAKYHQGASAENLAEAFPSLNIADIHAVLAYYLHNRETVDAYLDEAKQRDENSIHFIREKFPQDGLKEWLLARHKKRLEDLNLILIAGQPDDCENQVVFIPLS